MFKLRISERFIERRGNFTFTFNKLVELPFAPQNGLVIFIAGQFEIPVNHLLWDDNEQRFDCYVEHRMEVDVDGESGRELVDFVELKIIHGWDPDSARSDVEFSRIKDAAT
jgi:hypothetical protein